MHACRVAITAGQDIRRLEAEQLQWLLDSGDRAAAGAMLEKQGNMAEALALYLEGNAPIHAAKVQSCW